MFEPDYHLSDTLPSFLEVWRDDFRDFYGLNYEQPPEDADRRRWRAFQLLEKVAKEIVHSAKTLNRSGTNIEEVINQINFDLGIDVADEPFVKHCVESELARDFEYELAGRRERAVELIRFLMDVPYQRARAYLERVADCYIRGLRTETVVMCGAVLDAALQEHITDEEVRDHGVPCGRYVSLGNRLQYLHETQQLSEDSVERGFRVVAERNNAIHTAPDLSEEPIQIMSNLAAVLEELFDNDAGDSA